MVQLGVNSPEAQKEQELKKPGVLQETDAPIVLTMTAGPPVARPRPKKTCCSTRKAVCISLLVGLVAVAIVGGTLGYLYMHARRHCYDWGCFNQGRWNYYDDIVYPESDVEWFPAGESSSGPMGFKEPYIYPVAEGGDPVDPLAEPGDDGHGRGGHHGDGHRGGHRGGHRDHDDSGDHDDHHDGMPDDGSMPPPPPRPVY